MNNTMEESGLVPSLLVFGTIPNITTDLGEQSERLQALETAMEEMESNFSQRLITAALTHSIPAANDRVYKVRKVMLVFRKQQNCWVGHIIVTATEDKTVSALDVASDYRADFGKYQVKPYFRDLPETDANEDFAEILHLVLKSFVSDDVASKAPACSVHIS